MKPDFGFLSSETWQADKREQATDFWRGLFAMNAAATSYLWRFCCPHW